MLLGAEPLAGAFCPGSWVLGSMKAAFHEEAELRAVHAVRHLRCLMLGRGGALG